MATREELDQILATASAQVATWPDWMLSPASREELRKGRPPGTDVERLAGSMRTKANRAAVAAYLVNYLEALTAEGAHNETNALIMGKLFAVIAAQYGAIHEPEVKAALDAYVRYESSVRPPDVRPDDPKDHNGPRFLLELTCHKCVHCGEDPKDWKKHRCCHPAQGATGRDLPRRLRTPDWCPEMGASCRGLASALQKGKPPKDGRWPF